MCVSLVIDVSVFGLPWHSRRLRALVAASVAYPLCGNENEALTSVCEATNEAEAELFLGSCRPSARRPTGA